jgi:PAS domain S-box-containing protein
LNLKIKIMIKNWKFKTKIILLLVSLVFFSILASGVISTVMTRNSLYDRIGQDLTLSSNNLIENIDKFIYERYNDTQILISEPFVKLIEDTQSSSETKSNFLRNYLVNLGFYNGISLTDMTGKILASTDTELIGKDMSTEEWFLNAVKTFMYSSDYTLSKINNKPTIVFSNLILNSDNKPIGVVSAELSWPTVAEMLDSLAKDTQVFLVNKNNDIIAFSSDSDSSLLQNFLAELNDFKKSNEKSKFVLNNDGAYLLSFSKSGGYLGYLGNSWNLVLAVPTNVAYASIQQLIYILILFLFVVLIFTILVGFGYSRYLVRPIYSLVDGIEKIRRGNLKYKIKVDVKDEFGYLSNSFNRMTTSVFEKTEAIKRAFSKLRKEKKAVEREESRYKSILEVSGDAVLIIDSGKKIISFNDNFKKLFNVKESDFIGKDQKEINLFFSGKWEQSGFDEIIKNIEKNKNFSKTEFLVYKKPYYIIFFLTSPIISRTGKYMGRILLFRDITEEKELEKTRGEFITVASHKLRTPLTGIRWNLDLLLSGKVGDIPKKQKELMELMSKNTLTLNSLVNLLLSISKIEKDKIAIEPQEFYLEELLENVIERFKVQIDLLKLKLKTPNLTLRKLKVNLDKEKMRQVFNAVIENAVFYNNEKGKIQVDIKLNKQKIIVKVSDEGIGIPENEKRKILDKFYRGKKALLAYPDGIGLGLFLANVILKSSKGKIWFESENGNGSTFYIELPKS